MNLFCSTSRNSPNHCAESCESYNLCTMPRADLCEALYKMQSLAPLTTIHNGTCCFMIERKNEKKPKSKKNANTFFKPSGGKRAKMEKFGVRNAKLATLSA